MYVSGVLIPPSHVGLGYSTLTALMWNKLSGTVDSQHDTGGLRDTYNIRADLELCTHGSSQARSDLHAAQRQCRIPSECAVMVQYRQCSDSMLVGYNT